MNYFTELSKINVNYHVEKKGRFSYLSWAYAVAELKNRHPDATWEVKRYDNLPYQKTEAGVFVEVAVTVNGITHSQIHPVLNGNNRPIENPNAFDINTSIQRALVKAIALHGLGLYIYSGEDIPGAEAVKPEPSTADPAVIETLRSCESLEQLQTVWKSLSQEQREACTAIKDEMKGKLT